MRLAHSSTQVCAMRFSFESRRAFSKSLPDRSSHPVALVEVLAVGEPWAGWPCQVPSGLRTTALAIVIDEQIDSTPAGSCQTHVVLRYLAGEGHRMQIENGDCMYGTAVSEARGAEAVPGVGSLFVLCVRAPSAASILQAQTKQRPDRRCSVPNFQNPDRLVRMCPFFGNTVIPGSEKDSSPAAEGCVTGTNGRAGSEDNAPRGWGLA